MPSSIPATPTTVPSPQLAAAVKPSTTTATTTANTNTNTAATTVTSSPLTSPPAPLLPPQQLDCPTLLGSDRTTMHGWLEKLRSQAAKGKSRARVTAVLTGKFGQRKWKRRYFVLHQRTLYLYKSDKDPQPSTILPLTDYHSVTQDLDKFTDRHCLRMISMGKQRTVYASAETKDDLKRWMDALRGALTTNAEEQDQLAQEWSVMFIMIVIFITSYHYRHHHHYNHPSPPIAHTHPPLL